MISLILFVVVCLIFASGLILRDVVDYLIATNHNRYYLTHNESL